MNSFKSDFERLAFANRSNIVTELTFRFDRLYGKTKAETGVILVDFAVQKGLSERQLPIYGDTLRSWGDENTAPLWACKAALLLLMQNGWEPRSNTEWAVFAYLFIRINQNKFLSDLLPLLPVHYESTTAAGWLCAALEAQQNFLSERRNEFN